jgi:hypothetical protein
MPEEPQPSTATVFPVKSISMFQAALCINVPLKDLRPGILGHFQLLNKDQSALSVIQAGIY